MERRLVLRLGPTEDEQVLNDTIHRVSKWIRFILWDRLNQSFLEGYQLSLFTRED